VIEDPLHVLENGVTTALTATTRTGLTQFTSPVPTEPNLIFKLDGSHKRCDLIWRIQLGAKHFRAGGPHDEKTWAQETPAGKVCAR
jgi:hypothetical protein